MAEYTPISWCDRTWSPWEGCTKVSNDPQTGACVGCYAERMNKWLHHGENWGPGAPRRLFSADHWDKLERWNRQAEKAGKPISVFPSVCDPFDNEVDDYLRAHFFMQVEHTPWLRWLLLTKRIGNAAKMLPAHWFGDGEWPSHVRIGATVVTQEEAQRDLPKLLALDCPNFISAEPLMGPLDLDGIWLPLCDGRGEHTANVLRPSLEHRRIDWVIAGGESGPHARPSHPDWFRSLRDQCAAAGVPFHFKQWGEWLPCETDCGSPGEAYGVADDGSDRELSGRNTAIATLADHQQMARIGAKRAGRLLDGVEHNGFPA
jgi:protein gp37